MNTEKTEKKLEKEFLGGATPYEIFKWFTSELKLLLEEVEKAYGGCKFCYGKGYATQRETISGGHGRSEVYEVLDSVKPCSCDRGKQIHELNKSLYATAFKAGQTAMIEKAKTMWIYPCRCTERQQKCNHSWPPVFLNFINSLTPHTGNE